MNDEASTGAITIVGDPDRLEALGQFAGAIAHALNNSLSVVLNYATFVRDELPPDDPRRADVERIREGGESAAALVRALLAFGGRDFLRLELLDLNARVTASADDARRLGGAGVVVREELAPGLPLVMADAGAVDRMLSALIANAVEAMPDGGTLVLRTSSAPVVAEGDHTGDRAHPHRDAGVSASVILPSGPGVRVEVVDTGEGFSEHVMRRAFEPFVSTKAGRRGLGLATVYGIVKQLGGRVMIITRPGTGTTVRVEFPPADPAPRADDRSNASAPGTRGG